MGCTYLACHQVCFFYICTGLIALLAVGLVSLTTAVVIARQEAYNQQESDDLSLKAETNADGAVFWPVINNKLSLQA